MAKSVSGRLNFKTGVPNDVAFLDLKKLKAEYIRQVHNEFIRLSVVHGAKLKLPLALFVTGSLEEQTVIQNMMYGGYSLGQFGLVIDQTRSFLAAFTRYMQDNIFITPMVSSNKDLIMVSTELRFFIDYSEISKLDEAEYLSEKSMINIPWVSWLLTMGTQKITTNYRITFNPDIVAESNSRSGQAVMVKGYKGWSVPEEFAGTSNNNMIVNALKEMTGSSGDQINTLMATYYKNIFDSMF